MSKTIAVNVSQLISSRLFRRRRADERAGTLRAQGHGDIHLSLSRAFDEQTATRPGRWIRSEEDGRRLLQHHHHLHSALVATRPLWNFLIAVIYYGEPLEFDIDARHRD